MKIVTVVGARPQFIKAAVMSRHFFGNFNQEITEVIVHTGQHFDANMSEIFFHELQIPVPKYNLGIHGASHGKMTGRMLEAVERVIIDESPDYVLVYGDTNSTLAAALAAKKLQVKIIHIEAGLRSHNMKMPEEINRILTDRISNILCCPTKGAMENLKSEGFDNFDCRVSVTGDIMEDSAIFFREKISEPSSFLDHLGLRPQEYSLCTIHRQENVDNPERLQAIASILREISKHETVVIPMHPRTKPKFNLDGANIKLIEPVGYLDSLRLLKNCQIVLTDSGGLQKEAYFFQKYCITLRNETEWTELVDHGCNITVGADFRKAVEAYEFLKKKKWSAPQNLYGGGNAATRICEMIVADFKCSKNPI